MKHLSSFFFGILLVGTTLFTAESIAGPTVSCVKAIKQLRKNKTAISKLPKKLVLSEEDILKIFADKKRTDPKNPHLFVSTLYEVFVLASLEKSPSKKLSSASKAWLTKVIQDEKLISASLGSSITQDDKIILAKTLTDKVTSSESPIDLPFASEMTAGSIGKATLFGEEVDRSEAVLTLFGHQIGDVLTNNQKKEWDIFFNSNPYANNLAYKVLRWMKLEPFKHVVGKIKDPSFTFRRNEIISTVPFWDPQSKLWRYYKDLDTHELDSKHNGLSATDYSGRSIVLKFRKGIERPQSVIKKVRPDYESMKKDGVIRTVVFQDVIKFMTSIPETRTLMREYKEFLEGEGYKFTSQKTNDFAEYLKDGIATGKIDYIHEESHTDFSVFEKGNLAIGKNGKNEVVLFFPDKSDTRKLSFEEIGSALREREESTSAGRLLYFDSRCGSEDGLCELFTNAKAYNIDVIFNDEHSSGVEFQNWPSSAARALLNGVLREQTYAQISKDIDKARRLAAQEEGLSIVEYDDDLIHTANTEDYKRKMEWALKHTDQTPAIDVVAEVDGAKETLVIQESESQFLDW